MIKYAYNDAMVTVFPNGKLSSGFTEITEEEYNGYLNGDYELVDGEFVPVSADEKKKREEAQRDAEAQAELQQTIAAIKADMVAALLSDDTEWQEELKDEYNAVLNGEE